MPNWCNNQVTLKHSDPEMIKRAMDGFQDKGLLQALVPCPKALYKTMAGRHGDKRKQRRLERTQKRNLQRYGVKDWYDWCVSNWGTKWDVTINDGSMELTDDGLVLTFDSAWSPPLNAYEFMIEELGFDIVAYYYEAGCQFAGIWDNFDDRYYEGWGDAAGAKRELPSELEDVFNIAEMQEEWEADEY